MSSLERRGLCVGSIGQSKEGGTYTRSVNPGTMILCNIIHYRAVQCCFMNELCMFVYNTLNSMTVRLIYNEAGFKFK